MRDYETETYWKQYLPFFPMHARLVQDNGPTEEWFAWRGAAIHIDRFSSAGARATVIIVHGGGGYGRMFAPFGRLLCDAGHEVVAPDLPGYGLSRADPSLVSYAAWRDLLCDVIASERRRQARPIVLCGASLGGYLAYLCAARLPPGSVAGLVATTLADPRSALVRREFARNRLVLAMLPLMPVASALAGGVKVPIKWFTKMDAISNDPALSRLVAADPCGGGARVPLAFLKSIFDLRPDIEPEAFDRCPVLLAHPGEDRWTGLASSKQFFDRLKGPKRLLSLDHCGHLPVEEPGVSQLVEATSAFIADVTAGPFVPGNPS